MNVPAAIARVFSGRPYLGPLLVTAILVAPCIGTAYLWDDYQFLNNALSFKTVDLLPSSDPFYRPLSRGLYFAALDGLGPVGQLAGHLFNALTLLAIVALLTLLAGRLRGSRCAVVSGIAFASLGITPLLVCWASGAQDLIAIAFVLLAVHLHLSGRTGLSLVCAALGVLSKETAVVLIPGIALSRWILFGERRGIGKAIAMYTGLVAAWMFVHPGMQRLLQNGLRSGATGYVGLEHPERWPVYFGKYMLVLLNAAPAWPSWSLTLALLPYLIAAALITYFVTRRWPEDDLEGGRPSVSIPRLGIWALLLMVPPMLLSSTFVKVWVPYYGAFAGVGWAILVGVTSDRVRRPWLSAGLALFVAAGAWSRTAPLEPGAVTEHNLRTTSLALSQVQRNLHRIRPTMPRGAQALVSVQAGGLAGLYTHLYYFRALQVWYRDPSLIAVRPDWRKPSSEPEVLLWINSRYEVFEIDLDTLVPHGSTEAISGEEYLRTLRYYARGLAAGGETDRALQVLLSVREPNKASWAMDRRLAAMFLFFARRDAEATHLLQFVPPVRRDNALEVVARIVSDPPAGASWDEPALRAFGLQPGDPEVWRYLLHYFVGLGRRPDALRLAGRLLALRPGDLDASRTIEGLNSMSEREPFTRPVGAEGR